MALEKDITLLLSSQLVFGGVSAIKSIIENHKDTKDTINFCVFMVYFLEPLRKRKIPRMGQMKLAQHFECWEPIE
jgi:hypothetical protein